MKYNELIAGSRDAGPCPSQIRLSCKVVCLNNPVSFEPGDHPGVLSENVDEMVSKVIHKLNPVPCPEQTHRLMIQKEMLTIAGPRKEWVSYENLPLATVFERFNKFLDVGRFEQWKHSQWPTILSFLEEFSSLSIPAEALIYNLPLMEPRFYSVSVCRAHQPVWILQLGLSGLLLRMAHLEMVSVQCT